MNSFISRVQKDLQKFQKTIEKEGEDLIEKIKTLGNQAKNASVAAKRRDVEKLLEKKVKDVVPVVERLFKEVKTNARKYGIDLGSLEDKVRKSAARFVDAKPARKAAKKSTAKKAAAKKATTKKKAAKKAKAKTSTAKKVTKKKSTAKRT